MSGLGGKKPVPIPALLNKSAQLALAIQINYEATLADFCWDNNNQLLQTELQHTLKAQGQRLLYLWGTAGCGKSHLLQACCQEIHLRQSAIYLPLKALKDLGPGVLEGIEDQDFIAVDDIDVIAADGEWEEALFHLYNRVINNNHSRLMLVGKLPPAQMPIKLADLRSRLCSCFVANLHELSDADKILTLQRRAKRCGFVLPESVGQFLLTRGPRDMHALHALLHNLDTASLAAQRKITIPFAKEILGL